MNIKQASVFNLKPIQAIIKYILCKEKEQMNIKKKKKSKKKKIKENQDVYIK